MDFLRILISTVAIVVLPHLADAGCAQDTVKNKGFSQCVTGYSTFMINAAGAIDQSDPTAMMSIMCSTEGKAAMGCVLDYVKTCPDLMTSGDTAMMLQGLKALDQFGGMEAYCSMVSGPCTAVQECISKEQMGGAAEPETTPSAPFTPFSVIQPSMKMICGPLKGMFDCFKDVGDQCKDLEVNIKKMVDAGRSDLPAGTTIPTYEQTKTFVKKECPNIPKDFATSTCVKNALESEQFMKCFENVSTNYPAEEGKVTCDQVRAGHKCASMTVGKNCGQEYTNVFVKIFPMFVAGVPQNCKLETSPSGSSGIYMSSFAIISALSLALTLV